MSSNPLSTSVENPSVSNTETIKFAALNSLIDGTVPLEQRSQPSLPELVIGPNRLLSDIANDVGEILARNGFYLFANDVVSIDIDRKQLASVRPVVLRTMLERFVTPGVLAFKNGRTEFSRKSMGNDMAGSILISSQLKEKLPPITTANDIQLPVTRADGTISLLPEGYDYESKAYTFAGGPQLRQMPQIEAISFLRNLYSAFCFRENDSERSLAVAISALLSLLLTHVIPKDALLPAYIASANSEGSGKTLLWKIAILTRLGKVPVSSCPGEESEIRKEAFSAIRLGCRVLFFDNLKRHLNSGTLEALLTSRMLTGRILGKSETLEIEHSTSIFLTGNGCTLSPDMRRRVLSIELFLQEVRSEDRFIAHPLDETRIRELRGEILSAAFSLVRSWCDSKCPRPDKIHQSFSAWSKIVGGILQHAGFASICDPPLLEFSGDIQTREIEAVVAYIGEHHFNTGLKFNEVEKICSDLGLFGWKFGEDWEQLNFKNRSALSLMLKRYSDRTFLGRYRFKIIQSGQNRHSKRYIVSDIRASADYGTHGTHGTREGRHPLVQIEPAIQALLREKARIGAT